MNKVYQCGDELFVTLDATRRMRNLRTGLTLRPRGDFDTHFKYLGEMPEVGQVWELRSPGRSRFTVIKVSGGEVTLDHTNFIVKVTSLAELYKSFELVHPKKRLPLPTFDWVENLFDEAWAGFAQLITDNKEFLNANVTPLVREDAARTFVSGFNLPERDTTCPLKKSTLNRLNTGDVLGNWTKYRNTLGEKIRYANQKIKELSK